MDINIVPERNIVFRVGFAVVLKRQGKTLGQLRLTPYNPMTDSAEQGDVYPSRTRNVIHFHYVGMNGKAYYSIEKNVKHTYPMKINMELGDEIYLIYKVEPPLVMPEGYNGNMAYITGHISFSTMETQGNFIQGPSSHKIYE